MPQPAANNKTWFLLGREPLLSAAELFSLLEIKNSRDIEYRAPFLIYSGSIENNFIGRLGGTIKTGTEIGAFFSENELLETLKNDLAGSSGKIVFGISLYSKNANARVVENWGKKLKKELKAGGRSVRYVFNKETTLSSVTVEKNGLVRNGREFIIREDDGKFSVATTTSVQPFESFGARDFGRPGRDSESGMLPPKLALMLFNLAKLEPNETLLDPFCGSGTIISEALLQGHKNIIGSDLSEKAIFDSQKNIDWLKTAHPEIRNASIQIEVGDVTKIGEHIKNGSIGAIVTEPYLGKPLRGNEPEAEIQTQANELASLYTEAFGQFKKILRPGGRVVFIIPQFITRASPIVISDKFVQVANKLGFTAEKLLPEKIFTSNFILYRRSDQRVGREIWKFSLK